jgi:hypothetical protein
MDAAAVGSSTMPGATLQLLKVHGCHNKHKCGAVWLVAYMQDANHSALTMLH